MIEFTGMGPNLRFVLGTGRVSVAIPRLVHLSWYGPAGERPSRVGTSWRGSTGQGPVIS
jgi:hypothetical protein